MKVAGTIALMLSLVAAGASAQETPADSAATPPREVDTILIAPGTTFSGATPVTDERNFESQLIQNPTVALFKSMFIPGLGQIGNHAYTKAVLFAGLDGFFIYTAVKQADDAAKLRDLYEASTDKAMRNNYYDRYRNRAANRNLYTWLAVVTTVVAMFDAYVDAHLSGSPKRQNAPISLDITPPVDGTVAASVRIDF